MEGDEDLHGGVRGLMKENRSLRSSEWLLAASLSLILLSLFAIAKIQTTKLSFGSHRGPAMVEVVIEGFVEKPGIYSFAIGTPLGDALRQAKPKRFANLRAIDVKAPVKEAIHLQIEQLKEVRVHVEGAVVNPGLIEVALGTRICDLKKMIAFTEDVEPSLLKQRRMVRDGETITFPSKKKNRPEYMEMHILPSP